MKIGVVSDTHGRNGRLAAAVALLRTHGAEALVHCGDMTDTDAIQILFNSGLPSYVAAGNMDRDLLGSLENTARQLGVSFAPDVVAVRISDSDYLAATHGHSHVLQELISGGQFRYVVHGHSHVKRDEEIHGVRVLNPGALFHPKDGAGPSVLLLDTDADTAEFLSLG
jgi:hypothetical protein